MASKAESKLKSLLQKSELQMPPPHFTEVVMKEIQAIAEDTVQVEDRLLPLLQQQDLPMPAKEFTYSVLREIRLSRRQRGQPIIGTGAWTLIASFVVIYVIVAVVIGADAESSARQTDVISVGKYLSEMFLGFREILFYLGTIVVSTILLVSADYFFRRKLTSDNL